MTAQEFDVEFLEKIRERACSGMFSDLTDRDGRTKIWTDFKFTSDKNVLGLVRTIELKEVETKDENLQLGLPFLTSLPAGSVLVVKGSENFAYSGELMANLAMRGGVKGTIVFGASRDTRAISKLNYPLFAKTFTPVDIKGHGRVEAVDVAFSVDGYSIEPFSWVFADSDGVVFFSADNAQSILNEVDKLVDEETLILQQIAQGYTGEQLAKEHESF